MGGFPTATSFQKIVRSVVADIALPAANSDSMPYTCAVISNIDGKPPTSPSAPTIVGGAHSAAMLIAACDETPSLTAHAHRLAHKRSPKADRKSQAAKQAYLRGRNQVARAWTARGYMCIQPAQRTIARADVMEKVIKDRHPRRAAERKAPVLYQPRPISVNGRHLRLVEAILRGNDRHNYSSLKFLLSVDKIRR